MIPTWQFDNDALRKTPSNLDGILFEKEQRYRREGARFLIKVGTKMNLRYDTMATGVVYFHRFYMVHSFKQFPRFMTACSCLFLAGKVEETPKKCKDIIKTARPFLTESQFAQFGEDPKEELLTLERILLQTINFDLQVDHPYSYLIKYAKSIKCAKDGDKEKLQNVVQSAWTFINDSFCTTLCLKWEPEVIAIALLFLSAKLTRFEIVDWDGKSPHQKRWWDAFVENLSKEILEEICHQVLDIYTFPVPDDPQDSPPPTPTATTPSSTIFPQLNTLTTPVTGHMNSNPRTVPSILPPPPPPLPPTQLQANHLPMGPPFMAPNVYPFMANPQFSFVGPTGQIGQLPGSLEFTKYQTYFNYRFPSNENQ